MGSSQRALGLACSAALVLAAAVCLILIEVRVTVDLSWKGSEIVKGPAPDVRDLVDCGDDTPWDAEASRAFAVVFSDTRDPLLLERAWALWNALNALTASDDDILALLPRYVALELEGPLQDMGYRVIPRDSPAPAWRATGRFVQQAVASSVHAEGGGTILAIEALSLVQYDEVVVLDQRMIILEGSYLREGNPGSTMCRTSETKEKYGGLHADAQRKGTGGTSSESRPDGRPAALEKAQRQGSFNSILPRGDHHWTVAFAPAVPSPTKMGEAIENLIDEVRAPVRWWHPGVAVVRPDTQAYERISDYLCDGDRIILDAYDDLPNPNKARGDFQRRVMTQDLNNALEERAPFFPLMQAAFSPLSGVSSTLLSVTACGQASDRTTHTSTDGGRNPIPRSIVWCSRRAHAHRVLASNGHGQVEGMSRRLSHGSGNTPWRSEADSSTQGDLAVQFLMPSEKGGFLGKKSNESDASLREAERASRGGARSPTKKRYSSVSHISDHGVNAHDEERRLLEDDAPRTANDSTSARGGKLRDVEGASSRTTGAKLPARRIQEISEERTQGAGAGAGRLDARHRGRGTTHPRRRLSVVGGAERNRGGGSHDPGGGWTDGNRVIDHDRVKWSIPQRLRRTQKTYSQQHAGPSSKENSDESWHRRLSNVAEGERGGEPRSLMLGWIPGDPCACTDAPGAVGDACRAWVEARAVPFPGRDEEAVPVCEDAALRSARTSPQPPEASVVRQVQLAEATAGASAGAELRAESENTGEEAKLTQVARAEVPPPIWQPRPQSTVQVTEGDLISTQSYWLANEEKKLLIVAIPKVASTQMRALFLRLHGSEGWNSTVPSEVVFHRDMPKHVWKHVVDMSPQRATEIMNDSTWTRAVFFRDPAERLVSCFLDKIVQRKSYSTEIFKSNDVLSFKTFVALISKDARSRFAEEMPGARLGLTRYSNPHWRPQIYFIVEKFLPYFDFVGDFKYAEFHAEELLRFAGLWDEFGASGWGPEGTDAIFRRPTVEGLITGSQALKHFYLTPPLLARIREAYAESDYHMFAELGWWKGTLSA